MKPILASLSAFALLSVVSAADVGTSCHYDFSRHEMRSARASIANVVDHPVESKTSLRLITRDFMVVKLGQREFLSEMERGMRDITSFSRCWKEAGGHGDSGGGTGRGCATLTQPR
jgi:hypothetical protein